MLHPTKSLTLTVVVTSIVKHINEALFACKMKYQADTSREKQSEALDTALSPLTDRLRESSMMSGDNKLEKKKENAFSFHHYKSSPCSKSGSGHSENDEVDKNIIKNQRSEGFKAGYNSPHHRTDRLILFSTKPFPTL